ncbi:hypothetical protein [Nonomuraea glycinis]|uniref:hypothetical protein n=1 Tax=Nonomuraea glycinis TaxID=2047744 RepID=UPI0033B4EE47
MAKIGTGIDYEDKACEALLNGDGAAAQAWATLHQARMTRDLTAAIEALAPTRQASGGHPA